MNIIVFVKWRSVRCTKVSDKRAADIFRKFWVVRRSCQMLVDLSIKERGFGSLKTIFEYWLIPSLFQCLLLKNHTVWGNCLEMLSSNKMSMADRRTTGTMSRHGECLQTNGLIKPLLIHKDNSWRHCLILHGIVVLGVCQVWSQHYL